MKEDEKEENRSKERKKEKQRKEREDNPKAKGFQLSLSLLTGDCTSFFGLCGGGDDTHHEGFTNLTQLGRRYLSALICTEKILLMYVIVRFAVRVRRTITNSVSRGEPSHYSSLARGTQRIQSDILIQLRLHQGMNVNPKYSFPLFLSRHSFPFALQESFRVNKDKPSYCHRTEVYRVGRRSILN